MRQLVIAAVAGALAIPLVVMAIRNGSRPEVGFPAIAIEPELPTPPPLPQAEADPSAATLHNAFPGEPLPSAHPPLPAPAAVTTPFLAPRQISRESFGRLTGIGAVLLLGLFALAFALAGRTIRRLMRNWP
jgi:hypothetical protein